MLADDERRAERLMLTPHQQGTLGRLEHVDYVVSPRCILEAHHLSFTDPRHAGLSARAVEINSMKTTKTWLLCYCYC